MGERMMPRSKDNCYDQFKSGLQSLQGQLEPKSFDHYFSCMSDHELEFSFSDTYNSKHRKKCLSKSSKFFKKIILLTLSKCMKITRWTGLLCWCDGSFKVLLSDLKPKHNIVSDLITHLDQMVANLYRQFTMIRHQLDLIGRFMFAISNYRLPLNQNKRLSVSYIASVKCWPYELPPVRHILQHYRKRESYGKLSVVRSSNMKQDIKLHDASRTPHQFIEIDTERSRSGGQEVTSILAESDFSRNKGLRYSQGCTNETIEHQHIYIAV